jgi:GTP cyclohydrolase I
VGCYDVWLQAISPNAQTCGIAMIPEEHLQQAFKTLGLDPLSIQSPEVDIQRTPHRIVKMWREFTEGLHTEPPDIKEFESSHTEMLISRDIQFASICSHHFVPFDGYVHIGYLPDGFVCGLSKLARLADWYAKRPQTQELLTRQIAHHLITHLQPKGVAVVAEASHTCMTCRGANKPGSSFVTSAMLGEFRNDPSAKDEFLRLIGKK